MVSFSVSILFQIPFNNCLIEIYRVIPLCTLHFSVWCNFLTQAYVALQTILALLPFVHCGYIGTYCLFLAFHTYVHLLFLLTPSDDVCSGGTRHGQHSSPLVCHTTWMTDMLTNKHNISIFGFRSTLYQGTISCLHFYPATLLAVAQAQLLNNLPCLPHKPMATTPLCDKLSKWKSSLNSLWPLIQQQPAKLGRPLMAPIRFDRPPQFRSCLWCKSSRSQPQVKCWWPPSYRMLPLLLLLPSQILLFLHPLVIWHTYFTFIIEHSCFFASFLIGPSHFLDSPIVEYSYFFIDPELGSRPGGPGV